MKELRNLKIGTRLSLGFGLLILMMLGMALISGLRFGQVREVNQRLVEVDWLKVEAIHAVDVGTRANARRTMELVISTEAGQRAHIRERIEVNKRSITEALATLDRLIYRPEGRALLQELKAARERYVASFSKVSQLVDSGQRDEAIALLQREHTVITCVLCVWCTACTRHTRVRCTVALNAAFARQGATHDERTAGV